MAARNKQQKLESTIALSKFYWAAQQIEARRARERG